jgi:hypothetical protein
MMFEKPLEPELIGGVSYHVAPHTDETTKRQNRLTLFYPEAGAQANPNIAFKPRGN